MIEAFLSFPFFLNWMVIIYIMYNVHLIVARYTEDAQSVEGGRGYPSRSRPSSLPPTPVQFCAVFQPIIENLMYKYGI